MTAGWMVDMFLVHPQHCFKKKNDIHIMFDKGIVHAQQLEEIDVKNKITDFFML